MRTPITEEAKTRRIELNKAIMMGLESTETTLPNGKIKIEFSLTFCDPPCKGSDECDCNRDKD